MKYKIMVGYGEQEEVGILELKSKKLSVTTSDKDIEEMIKALPYDLETEGDEALKLLKGQLAFSSTISLVLE